MIHFANLRESKKEQKTFKESHDNSHSEIVKKIDKFDNKSSKPKKKIFRKKNRDDLMKEDENSDSKDDNAEKIAIEEEKKKRLEQKQKERELKEEKKRKQRELKDQARLEAEKRKMEEKKHLEEERKKRLEEKMKERELADKARIEAEAKRLEEKKQLDAEKQKRLEEKRELEEVERQKRLEEKIKEKELAEKARQEAEARRLEEKKQLDAEKQKRDEERKKLEELELQKKIEAEKERLKQKEADETERKKQQEVRLKEKEAEKQRKLEAKQQAAEEKLKRKEEKKKDAKIKFIDMRSEKSALPRKYDQSEMEIVRIHMEDKIIKKDPSKDTVQEGDLIYERKGFGWKGFGSRRIYYDTKLKEYRYEIIEPTLNEDEKAMKDKLVHLFRVRADVDVFETDKYEKMKHLKDGLDGIIANNHIEIEALSKDRIYYYIFQDFIGYGKIDIMMNDEGIEDISCDGHGVPLFIYHKTYESIKSNVIFEDGDELNSFVVKLSQMCGKQLSVYEPVVDGKLYDGSRLQTTLAKTITKKSTFTIRRFREDPLTPIDLIANNTISVEMAAYFWLTIESGASVLFCGGTASGKTTMLNALSLFLPAAYKIVSVEDTREINLPHENWIAGTTRTGFSSSEEHKTAKDIDMFDLIKIALRQRPRAIIVGEVRGREAYSLFQAMTTGHLSYSTIHASDMHSLIQRLESPPISLPRALLTSLDLVIFMNNLTVDNKPVRRITNITEIIKLDPETNRLVTISPFNWVSEIDDRFEVNRGSRMMNKIRLSKSWDEKTLNKEIQNRIKVLEWMTKKNIRSYTKVGKIVSKYFKDPEAVLKKVKDSP